MTRWLVAGLLSLGVVLVPVQAVSDTTPPSLLGSVTVAAVGDINPPGNISWSSPSGRNAASVAAAGVDAFLNLGDWQYSSSTCATYPAYDALWGPLMPVTLGTAGNHDVKDKPAYLKHTAGTCPGQTTGPAMRPNGWDEPYVYDLGAWRVFSMPSDVGTARVASLLPWLRGELESARLAGDHVLAFWHKPFWSSSTTAHPATEGDFTLPWIRALYEGGARLVVSGHQHGYERFVPQTPSSARDDVAGVQQFLVGTGGGGLYPYVNQVRGSVTQQPVGSRSNGARGWLELTLNDDGSYAWRFVKTSGRLVFSDSGFRGAMLP